MWQGTIVEGEQVHTVSSGTCSPVHLPYPDAAPRRPSLQHFCYAWRYQDAVYHLAAPASTFMQLPRFRVGNDGQVFKSAFEVDLSLGSARALRLPCGTREATQWVCFKIVAIIFHLGDTVHSRHYVALLFRGDTAYLRDDREAARKATSADLRTALSLQLQNSRPTSSSELHGDLAQTGME